MGEIIMPTELTAENGARYAFIGEFNATTGITCVECYMLDEPDPECSICNGDGFYKLSIPISWTTIKEIYKKAVELLGKPI